MFIVWGKKYVHRSLGYVADFCPMCRGPRQFAVSRVGLANHVYYITSGDGELVGHERACQGCGIKLNADPATYAAISKERLPLEELMRKTYPNFEEALQGRLALEEKLKTAPDQLSYQERTGLLRLPFFLLSPKVQARYGTVQFDAPAVIVLIVTVILLPILCSLAESLLPVGPVADYTLAALIIGGIGLIIWQIVASGGRFLKRDILPPLTEALKPLQPSEAEIKEVLAELRKGQHKMGSKLKPAVLMEALRA